MHSVNRTVHTIGHSTRGFEDLIIMLRRHDIDCLVDVRAYPASRANPQWNQAAVVVNLPTDIDYHWIRDLGGRRHTPAGVQSVNDAWRVRAFRDYADYMASDAFRNGIETLLDLARHRQPAMMCSEAVPWRCHRRLITDALLVAGSTVVHIMSATQSRPATLTPHASVRAGVLIYPSDDSTDLVVRVQLAIREIPHGRVASYGDVGRAVGAGARQVGSIMREINDETTPWWRVVHADGTPPTCHRGSATALLAGEQTPIRGARIDMTRARHQF